MPVVNLTANVIKRLHCPEGKRRIEYCDRQSPGFYVEVRRTTPGKGTYYLRHTTEQKKNQHFKLGTTTEISLSQARKKAKTLRAELVMEKTPQKAQKSTKAVPTIKAFVEEKYLDYIKTRKRSWKTDYTHLRSRVIPAFGDKRLDEVSHADVAQFHNRMRNEGRAPATCDRQLMIIRALYAVAMEWELVDSNPAKSVKLFKEDNKRERYLDEAETKRLLDVLLKDRNRPVCCIVLFLLSTGARVGEALKAKWSDIDLTKQTWRIPVSNAKSKKERIVPLNTSALQVLVEARRECGGQEWIFVSPKTQAPFKSITLVWHRLRDKAGLPDFRLHDCRHTYASKLVGAGRSLYEVQQILGHSNPKVTERYAHLSQDSLLSAASSANWTYESDDDNHGEGSDNNVGDSTEEDDAPITSRVRKAS
ncbi:tyrosine-type recombinase/integrase [Billgrantia montanilacus]|nr:tyrosine-type recombinase/integrase [Halomonas montanilacus]